jgi:xanthine dehydrogenase YagT iron-sulfur-binding subunit
MVEEGKGHRCGLTRRGFIASLGAGAIASGAGAGAEAGEEPGKDLPKLEEMTSIVLLVNGRSAQLLVEPRWTLLFVLREKLGLTAAKEGCERGECGACTVLIDDRPRYACMTLAVEAEGRRITTAEGLLDGEELGPTQKAFAESDAFQCGYCTPGQVLAVEGLLRANPDPTSEEIRLAMTGNLCRCGTYWNIFRAARRATELRKGGKP